MFNGRIFDCSEAGYATMLLRPSEALQSEGGEPVLRKIKYRWQGHADDIDYTIEYEN